MKEESKTKKQLTKELGEFHQYISKLQKKETKLKRLMGELRENPKVFETLFRLSQDGLVLHDQKFQFILGNPTAIKMFGFANHEEFVSKTALDVSPKYQPDGALSSEKAEKTIAIAEKKGSHLFEWKNCRIDGTEFFVNILLTPLKVKGKKLLLVTARDITEEKRLEKEVLKSEEMFRNVFSASPIGKIIYNSEGKWVNANKAVLEILGLTGAKNLNWPNLFDSFFVKEEEIIKLLQLKSVSYEFPLNIKKIKQLNFYPTREKGIFYLHIWITPLTQKSNSEVWGYLVHVQDISEQKRKEEYIHLLNRQILDSLETRRLVISRELHDRVAQDLSLLRIRLETLFDNQSATLGEIKQSVYHLSKTLQGTIIGVRDLAYSLHPPSLDQLGLVHAVSQYCQDFSKKSGVKVKFYSLGMDDLNLPFQIKINLFHVIREALNNIQKHAEASNVVIKFSASYPKIILRIVDDGKGFNLKDHLEKALREKRLGLWSMEERVKLINGKIVIQSRPGEGTKIFVEVPYKENKK